MEIEMGKWGNSAAFRVPAELVRKSGLKIGSKMEIVFEDGALRIKPLKPKMSRAERYERILADLDKYGPDQFIDSGPLVGREIPE